MQHLPSLSRTTCLPPSPVPVPDRRLPPLPALTKGVPEGNGAAVGVDLGRVETQLLHAVRRLRACRGVEGEGGSGCVRTGVSQFSSLQPVRLAPPASDL